MSALGALWVSIFFGAIAQVMLKRGVGHSTDSARVSAGWWMALLRNGWVWGWGISFVAATILWLLALSAVDISYAFPLLSAGFILVALLSRVLLKEIISPKRWVAILIIGVGVVLISMK